MLANALMIHPNLLLQNRYRVLRVLGKGGFAETFEVDDRGSLKVLKALSLNHFYSRDAKEKAVSLFQREAAVLSRLQHPGIPKVEPDGYFTVPQGSEEPLHCLVMEKIDGMNLKQWRLKWRERTLSEEQAITWLRQLAQILEQLHQQELIHRDIKPSNIMLRSNGQLALIDFGAVREVTDTYLQRQKENVTGTVIISSGYTPPEQAEGHAVAQSDFFALGRTFVFLLTGKSPIDFDRHSRTGKLLWRESAPHISPELADLMDYLMAAFPGQRPQTPQMILRCIEEIVSPPPLLPPPPPIQSKMRSPDVQKPKPLLGLIANFLSNPFSPNPWEKVTLYRTLSGHRGAIRAIAISPDGQRLASGSDDTTIKLWVLPTGRLQHTLTGHTHRITGIGISPDSQMLASGSYDKTIKLWSLDSGDVVNTLITRPDRVRDIAFSPNGQMLVSISEGDIKLWAVRTGKLLRSLGENSDAMGLVAFHPDGHICAIASLNGSLELWNPHIGKRMSRLPSQSSGIASLVFSPDGEMLACGSSRAIELWNPTNGKRLRAFSPHSNGVVALAFSPDGEILASASGTTIELWNAQSGKRLGKLVGHSQAVRALAFSPDGDSLVSGGSDRKIKIWQSV